MSKDIDKEARRIVRISKIDAEDCTWAPNDFEKCVELIKKMLLSDPRSPEYRELDDLIFERSVQQLQKKYDVELDVKLIPVYDDDDNKMYG